MTRTLDDVTNRNVPSMDVYLVEGSLPEGVFLSQYDAIRHAMSKASLIGVFIYRFQVSKRTGKGTKRTHLGTVFRTPQYGHILVYKGEEYMLNADGSRGKRITRK